MMSSQQGIANLVPQAETEVKNTESSERNTESSEENTESSEEESFGTEEFDNLTDNDDVSDNFEDQFFGEVEDWPDEGTGEMPCTPLIEKLGNWCFEHRITHQAMRDLLEILREENPTLPVDPQTVMARFLSDSDIQVVDNSLLYLGVEKALNFIVDATWTEDINLNFNVDGLPLSG